MKKNQRNNIWIKEEKLLDFLFGKVQKKYVFFLIIFICFLCGDIWAGFGFDSWDFWGSIGNGNGLLQGSLCKIDLKKWTKFAHSVDILEIFSWNFQSIQISKGFSCKFGASLGINFNVLSCSTASKFLNY